MTVAEPARTLERSRPGWGRLHAVPLAVAALLLAPGGALATQQTQRHDTGSNKIVDSDGGTRARLSGKLTFYREADNGRADEGKYDADFWIHNGTASSASVYFKFHYENGDVATSRTWGNPNGAGTSLRHVAWIGREGQTRVPRVEFITVVLTAAGRPPSVCHYRTSSCGATTTTATTFSAAPRTRARETATPG